MLNNNRLQNVTLSVGDSKISNFDTITSTAYPMAYLDGVKKALKSSDNGNLHNFYVNYNDTRDFVVDNFNNSSQTCFFKVIPYKKDTFTVNKPVLVAGHMPEPTKTVQAMNEITLSPNFAKAKKINLNDVVTINKASFKVVGFALNPNYIYPYLNRGFGLPSLTTTSIVYASSSAIFRSANNIFNPSSISNREVYYSFYFPSLTTTQKVNAGVLDFEKIINDPKNTFVPKQGAPPISLNSVFNQKTSPHVFNPRSSDYLYNERQNMFFNILKFNNYFSYSFIAFTGLIAAILLFVLAIKRIENDARIIGTFKAFGYSKLFLAATYFAYPLLISLGGGILGWLISFAVQIPVVNLYYAFFDLPISLFTVSWWTLIIAAFWIFVILAIFTLGAFAVKGVQRPVLLLR